MPFALVLSFGIFTSAPPDWLGLTLELLAAGIGIFTSGVLLTRALSPSWLSGFQDDRRIWFHVIEILLVIWITTLGFAYLSSYLVYIGAIHIQGHLSEFTIFRALPRSTFGLLIWNFANVLPALDVTKTLNWTYPYQFSNFLGGALVLVYKIAVALPVIQLFRLLLNRTRPSETGQPKVADVTPSTTGKLRGNYRFQFKKALESIKNYIDSARD